MKKLLLIIGLACGTALSASAQLLPSFQFGVKGGVNLTNLSTTSVSGNFSHDNRAGYLGGFWARIGGAGIYLQPEAYITSKSVNIHNTGSVVIGGDAVSTESQNNHATFTSIDIPILLGTKFGILGNGIRINTGPVLSYAINKNQSVGDDTNDIAHLNYKGQNYAWQFGVGADIRRLSVDLRYEAGLNKVTTNNDDHVRINLFNLTLGYRLFSL